MKVIVAMIDRGETRAMPQTPCPEVHPPPNVTPIPTRNPPMINIGVSIGTEMSGTVPVANVTTKGPETMPAMNAALQDQSAIPEGVRNPARIPVAPMIRPTNAIDRTAANPINRPPPSDKNGVNVVSIHIHNLGYVRYQQICGEKELDSHPQARKVRAS